MPATSRSTRSTTSKAPQLNSEYIVIKTTPPRNGRLNASDKLTQTMAALHLPHYHDQARSHRNSAHRSRVTDRSHEAWERGLRGDGATLGDDLPHASAAAPVAFRVAVRASRKAPWRSAGCQHLKGPGWSSRDRRPACNSQNSTCDIPEAQVYRGRGADHVRLREVGTAAAVPVIAARAAPTWRVARVGRFRSAYPSTRLFFAETLTAGLGRFRLPSRNQF